MERKELSQGLLARGVMLGLCMMGLAACGGGGGGGNVRSEPPPPAPTAPPPVPPVIPVPTVPPEPTTPTTPRPPLVPPAPPPPIDAHLYVTKAYEANAMGYTGKGVAIAFLDTGLNKAHPTFGGRVTRSEVNVDPATNDLSVDDKNGHGTKVAQIAAGQKFGDWPRGIAPEANLVSLRILNDVPEADGRQKVLPSTTLPNITWPLSEQQARIFNVSTDQLYWDDEAVSARMFDMFNFVTVRNQLVVMETGDGGAAQPSQLATIPEMAARSDLGMYPATLQKGWINVSAVDSNDPTKLASYANACGRTRNYCMVAPGDVIVTGPNDTTTATYSTEHSTDYAAPQVSAAAALVWQAFPYMTNDLVRQTLLASATDLGAPGVDEVFGWGLLNVGKAVKGPSKLAWGDVDVKLRGSNATHWSNNISGDGGLILSTDEPGSAPLFLDGVNTYTGKTKIINTALVVTNSLASSIELQVGMLQIMGGTITGDIVTTRSFGGIYITPVDTYAPLVIEGDIVNEGVVFEYRPQSATAAATFKGDYTQGPFGRISIGLGEPFHIQGKATLDGDLSVYIKPGYIARAHTEVLIADGGITGGFDRLLPTGGLLVEATMGSDANTVWLDVTRAEVTASATSLGFRTASVASAQRVEEAFQQIDTSLSGLASEKADEAFISGAGAIQQVTTPEALDQSLASLSGELHDADGAFAMMAIEGNRHALESRLDALQGHALSGAWSDRIDGKRGWSAFDVDASGWMLGVDQARNGLTLGAAVSETDGYAWHSDRADSERNRQVEGQMYAAWDLDGGYVFGSAAFGHMQRWMRREIALGEAQYRVSSDYTHRYGNLALQAGRRFAFGDSTLTPYIGAQALQLDRDGFSEQGAAGFGLTSAAGSMRANQAILGTRFGREWLGATARWDLQGRLEWQHLLSQSGQAVEARFTAMDAWAPIVGDGLDRDVGVFGLSLGAGLGRAGRLSFDLDSRYSGGQSWTGAQASWTVGF